MKFQFFAPVIAIIYFGKDDKNIMIESKQQQRLFVLHNKNVPNLTVTTIMVHGNLVFFISENHYDHVKTTGVIMLWQNRDLHALL